MHSPDDVALERVRLLHMHVQSEGGLGCWIRGQANV